MSHSYSRGVAKVYQPGKWLNDTSKSPRPPSSGCDSLFTPEESTLPSNPISGTRQISSALLDKDTTPSSGGAILVFGLSKSRFNRVSSVLMSIVTQKISAERHLSLCFTIIYTNTFDLTSLTQQCDKDYRLK